MSGIANADGFGRAIAGTGRVFLLFLAVHVLAGLAAVISWALGATAPKRRGWHTRAGTVYSRGRSPWCSRPPAP